MGCKVCWGIAKALVVSALGIAVGAVPVQAIAEEDPAALVEDSATVAVTDVGDASDDLGLGAEQDTAREAVAAPQTDEESTPVAETVAQTDAVANTTMPEVEKSAAEDTAEPIVDDAVGSEAAASQDSESADAKEVDAEAKAEDGTGSAAADVFGHAEAPEGPVASAMALSTSAEAAQTTTASTVQALVSYVDMNRLYNPYTGEHFYTSNAHERDVLVTLGWRYEGTGWTAPTTSDRPVFRLYNPYAGDHHYTQSTTERDGLTKVGWRYEGIGWYSEGDYGEAVYRQYNPYAVAGTHNYTTSKQENDSLVKAGWRAEGIAWYGTAFVATASFQATEGGETQTVQLMQKGDAWYACLPSYAPASSVTVTVTTSDDKPVRLREGAGDVAVGKLSSTRASTGELGKAIHLGLVGAQRVVVPLQSSNVRTIFLTSADAINEGRAYVEASADHSAKASVRALVVNADGSVDYDADKPSKGKYSTVKGRGNSTWGIGNKKPYQLTLNKKADLLQTGDKGNAQKKWVLLANAGDATLLHNWVALDFARELGLAGVECAPVDLYYDGEYRGSYLLTEKIEAKPGRVDISDLEGATEGANPEVDLDALDTQQATNALGYQIQYVTGIADPQDITGGYLVEADGAYYKGERSWFRSGEGAFVVKSPESCSKSEVEYVSVAFERAIRNAKANRFDLDDDFSFDLSSLTKAYLVNELFKNIDAFYTSTYFHLDAGSRRIYCEPVWDFDTSTGTRTDTSGSGFACYEGYVVPSAAWLRAIPSVQQRFSQLWDEQAASLAKNVLLGGENSVGGRGILRSLSWYQGQLRASQRMNEVTFGVTAFPNCMTPLATWGQNVDYMEQWLANRVEWISGTGARIAQTDPVCTYQGIDYGMVYDYQYYLQQNPDVFAAYGGNPALTLRHFVEYGMAEGRTSCRNFQVNAYRSKNDDLDAAFGDDLAAYYRHYATLGYREGRLAC